jgi:uncharacterized membrane-anchored protein YhcB (DUF1043 family)
MNWTLFWEGNVVAIIVGFAGGMLIAIFRNKK